MSKEIKDIPQDFKIWYIAESRKQPQSETFKEWKRRGQQLCYEVAHTEGYQEAAEAAYRHLFGRSITAHSNHAALAIQWDATGRVWKVLEDAGISIEPGPMGDKTFSLIKENGDKEQVLLGDWIIKDQAG